MPIMLIRDFKLIQSREILSLEIRKSTKGANVQNRCTFKEGAHLESRVTFKKQSKQN